MFEKWKAKREIKKYKNRLERFQRWVEGMIVYHEEMVEKGKESEELLPDLKQYAKEHKERLEEFSKPNKEA